MLLILIMTLWSINIIQSLDSSCDYSRINDVEDFVQVRCQGNDSLTDTLKEILSNITEPIRIFELRNSVLDALPDDIFQATENAVVEKVVFDNVSLELLSVPTLGDPPFESVQKTLQHFEVYDSSHVFAWNLSSLSHMQNMKSLIVENSDVFSLYVPFSVWPALQFVQIINSRLKWIHPRLLQANQELAICSFSNNEIRHVQRSMFPEPASNLWSLDLSYNWLEWLPENIFSDMDALIELKIDNNQLKEVSQRVFSPVWNNLTQFWLDGNPFFCSTADWTNGTRDLPLFMDSSRCHMRNKIVLFDAYFKGYY
ncbi:carboxypeptidase N subunit 2-like [Uloborus diversus]|uniref:carboxypeptidase N subunit 2-like n=1 Tax=Uloborus diversus TaxID=327109 RepID=UPI0024093C9D|nr:carboxypeptidase N subunit 2-like [Uloborus diversus]XP_054718399.1 carboxypeptidase N subunit 2-like [Uloborus diversus]